MYNLAFLQNLSSWELILIFMVVLLFFGAKRLPGLAKSLGKSLREFKNATSGIENDLRNAMEADDEATSSSLKPMAAKGSVSHTSTGAQEKTKNDRLKDSES
jgi:sec-independent protein translocase protein TatA